MNKFNITSAKRLANDLLTNEEITLIKATIDGVEMFVPIDPANSHYAAIMEMVNAGTLTIAEADE